MTVGGSDGSIITSRVIGHMNASGTSSATIASDGCWTGCAAAAAAPPPA